LTRRRTTIRPSSPARRACVGRPTGKSRTTATEVSSPRFQGDPKSQSRMDVHGRTVYPSGRFQRNAEQPVNRRRDSARWRLIPPPERFRREVRRKVPLGSEHPPKRSTNRSAPLCSRLPRRARQRCGRRSRSTPWRRKPWSSPRCPLPPLPRARRVIGDRRAFASDRS
jgi:hypothetical protein